MQLKIVNGSNFGKTHFMTGALPDELNSLYVCSYHPIYAAENLQIPDRRST